MQFADMNAPANLSTVQQLRARDGGLCWLCFGKLDFAAVPNSKNAPTIEHLLSKANGGTNSLDNLVLTHPGCNKHLGCRPVADKRRMRENRRVNREKQLAAVNSRTEKPALAVRARRLQDSRPAQAPREDELTLLRASLRRWQALAIASGGAGLFAIGFVAGLLAGR